MGDPEGRDQEAKMHLCMQGATESFQQANPSSPLGRRRCLKRYLKYFFRVISKRKYLGKAKSDPDRQATTSIVASETQIETPHFGSMHETKGPMQAFLVGFPCDPGTLTAPEWKLWDWGFEAISFSSISNTSPHYFAMRPKHVHFMRIVAACLTLHNFVVKYWKCWKN